MSRKLYDNTETLEEVLELLNNKAAGGGGTDTSDATATSADILIYKTAYANGEKITGSIPLQSAKTITPSASEQVAISSGYYASGDVKVQGDANLTADNIKKGATIFGVEGNYEGGGGGGVNKLASVVDGTITEITAQDLAGVTKIRTGAFYFSSLTSVEIPDGATEIGNYAFRNSTSLTSVEIPNSVTTIGDYAFASCSKLTSIEIPNSVTFLSDYAFQTCTSLTNAVIGNGVTAIRSYVFADCSKLASVIIPNSVTRIDSNAFRYCSSLTNVVIGNSVTTIGDYAFSWCSSLTSIEIPNSVAKVNPCAFQTCTSLTSVVFGSGVTNISRQAFQACSSLKRVDFSSHTAIPTLGSGAFSSTHADLQIKVPASLIDNWKSATNWSDYASKIVTEFTNTL
jgi:hypothetical protein